MDSSKNKRRCYGPNIVNSEENTFQSSFTSEPTSENDTPTSVNEVFLQTIDERLNAVLSNQAANYSQIMQDIQQKMGSDQMATASAVKNTEILQQRNKKLVIHSQIQAMAAYIANVIHHSENLPPTK